MKKILLLLLTLLSLNLIAKEVPRLTSPVVDTAGVLEEYRTNLLRQSLSQAYKETGVQLQVLVVKSIEDESIESYAIKVADQWKLGSEAEDKGLLFLVSIDDRKMRVEVGQGLEGQVTDLVSGRIIDNIKPFFRNKEYDDGIYAALRLLGVKAGVSINITDPKKTHRNRKRRNSGGTILFVLVMISLFGRRSLPLMLLMGGGRGGFGGGFGGSSGGGSSWSGGGGGFSGGGASGDW